MAFEVGGIVTGIEIGEMDDKVLFRIVDPCAEYNIGDYVVGLEIGPYNDSVLYRIWGSAEADAAVGDIVDGLEIDSYNDSVLYRLAIKSCGPPACVIKLTICVEYSDDCEEVHEAGPAAGIAVSVISPDGSNPSGETGEDGCVTFTFTRPDEEKEEIIGEYFWEAEGPAGWETANGSVELTCGDDQTVSVLLGLGEGYSCPEGDLLCCPKPYPESIPLSTPEGPLDLIFDPAVGLDGAWVGCQTISLATIRSYGTNGLDVTGCFGLTNPPCAVGNTTTCRVYDPEVGFGPCAIYETSGSWPVRWVLEGSLGGSGNCVLSAYFPVCAACQAETPSGADRSFPVNAYWNGSSYVSIDCAVLAIGSTPGASGIVIGQQVWTIITDGCNPFSASFDWNQNTPLLPYVLDDEFVLG